MNDTRRTYKYIDGVFIEVPFSSLTKGDLFKLVDEGEEPFEVGVNIYKAASDVAKDGTSVSAILEEIQNSR